MYKTLFAVSCLLSAFVTILCTYNELSQIDKFVFPTITFTTDGVEIENQLLFELIQVYLLLMIVMFFTMVILYNTPYHMLDIILDISCRIFSLVLRSISGADSGSSVTTITSITKSSSGSSSSSSSSSSFAKTSRR